MNLDEKMSPPEPMDPVSVTMIDTSIGMSKGTGDGVPKGTIATTPGHLPNLVVNIVSPLVALAVRFVNVYAASILGLASAAGMTEKGAALLGAGDFGALLYNCAMLSIAPAGLDFIKNLVTIFGRLEGKYPLLTGQV